MTITGELKNLEKVQTRLIHLCNYIEKKHPGHYNDLYIKLGQVIGNIEEILNYIYEE